MNKLKTKAITVDMLKLKDLQIAILQREGMRLQLQQQLLAPTQRSNGYPQWLKP